MDADEANTGASNRSLRSLDAERFVGAPHVWQHVGLFGGFDVCFSRPLTVSPAEQPTDKLFGTEHLLWPMSSRSVAGEMNSAAYCKPSGAFGVSEKSPSCSVKPVSPVMGGCFTDGDQALRMEGSGWSAMGIPAVPAFVGTALCGPNCSMCWRRRIAIPKSRSRSCMVPDRAFPRATKVDQQPFIRRRGRRANGRSTAITQI
jgi:hypothetical protein